VLHLLGYDHDTPERERRMRRKQRSVLQPLGYRRTP
jgi:ssRNA-specific RNase YbeY (16S rRNA maturation enzyme)